LDGQDGTPTVSNPYHYPDNDPINMVDPTGMAADDANSHQVCSEWDCGPDTRTQLAPLVACALGKFPGCSREESTKVEAEPLRFIYERALLDKKLDRLEALYEATLGMKNSGRTIVADGRGAALEFLNIAKRNYPKQCGPTPLHKPVWCFSNAYGVPSDANAFALGHYRCCETECSLGSVTHRHEMHHVEQWERWGDGFDELIKIVVEFRVRWQLSDRPPCSDRYERAAYRAGGDGRCS